MLRGQLVQAPYLGKVSRLAHFANLDLAGILLGVGAEV
ncbi:hypothetical protein P308_28555 [Pseudomonas piscis]|nr:hypothetical protein P308_28555 [Pseudomonas piscis]